MVLEGFSLETRDLLPNRQHRCYHLLTSQSSVTINKRRIFHAYANIGFEWTKMLSIKRRLFLDVFRSFSCACLLTKTILIGAFYASLPYVVALDKIIVGDKIISQLSNKIIIDTGTSFTYLPLEVYAAVTSGVRKLYASALCCMRQCRLCH
jgi:hypothetical protein